MPLSYPDLARAKVADTEKDRGYVPDDFYVVWFSKTLQNWKALISTDIEHGRYWEVTHNGDKHETYVDAYRKEKNTVVHDAL